jgi:hypothetical protein
MKCSSVTRLDVTKGKLCGNGSEHFCNVIVTLVKQTSKQTHFSEEYYSRAVFVYILFSIICCTNFMNCSNCYLLLLTYL